LPQEVAPMGAPCFICKDQVTRRDSVARRARSNNWRFAAGQGSWKTLSATIDVKVVYHSAPA
jgi:hypothetical protein